MKTINLLIAIIVLINIGCQKEPPKILTEFQLPQVVNSEEDTTKGKKHFAAEHIEEVFPLYAGKYKFSEVIDINLKRQDTSIRNDFVNEIYLMKNQDTLDVNGFELYTDYTQNVYKKYRKDTNNLYSYYPVYFVNSTNKEKFFLAKDSYVYGIQEAKDTGDYNKWRPIEGRGYDFCGNGHWGMRVKPNEFIVVLMRKYQGEHRTSLRTRFQIGETLYISQSFDGYINNSQFNFSDNSYYKSRLSNTNGDDAKYFFYGAELNEEKWKVTN